MCSLCNVLEVWMLKVKLDSSKFSRVRQFWENLQKILNFIMVMKLVSKLIYGVNFKRINSDPHQCQIDNFDQYYRRHVEKKFENLCRSFFLWPSITYLNEKIIRIEFQPDRFGVKCPLCYTRGDPIFILCDFDAIASIRQLTSYTEKIHSWRITE